MKKFIQTCIQLQRSVVLQAAVTGDEDDDDDDFRLTRFKNAAANQVKLFNLNGRTGESNIFTRLDHIHLICFCWKEPRFTANISTISSKNDFKVPL